MPNVGPLELAIVLIIALVIFGPKRLPELGRSMGRGIREFRASISSKGGDDDEEKSSEPAQIEGAEAGAESESPERVESEVVTENRT
jgi:sec-independent protein translocase protein TatA